jgi:hypothetical protein
MICVYCLTYSAYTRDNWCCTAVRHSSVDHFVIVCYEILTDISVWNSLPLFSGVRVALSLVLCVVSCRLFFVKIFINFEIYRKGHCRTERVVLSTIIYTCIVSFVQVHDENKYTEVGSKGYEFNINNSCCLWVVRRSQWGTYMIHDVGCKK